MGGASKALSLQKKKKEEQTRKHKESDVNPKSILMCTEQ
jgi:hypothetical protein